MRGVRRGRGGFRGANPGGFFPYMAAIPMPYFYRGGSRGRTFRYCVCGCVWLKICVSFFFLMVADHTAVVFIDAHCHLQGKGKKQLVCPLLTEHT